MHSDRHTGLCIWPGLCRLRICLSSAGEVHPWPKRHRPGQRPGRIHSTSLGQHPRQPLGHTCSSRSAVAGVGSEVPSRTRGHTWASGTRRAGGTSSRTEALHTRTHTWAAGWCTRCGTRAPCTRCRTSGRLPSRNVSRGSGPRTAASHT